MKKENPNYLVLINGDNKIPDGFEETVEIITVENSFAEKYRIEKKAYEAFLKLREDLLNEDGIQVELFSVYRPFEYQEKIFQDYLKERGEEYTNKYIAKPGHSEHQTGLGLDVSIVKDGKLTRGIENLLSLNNLYKIVHKKLPKYGFILRYPEGKEDFTKIGYETWHFRYIDSPEIAKEITDKGLCFEEYMKNK